MTDNERKLLTRTAKELSAYLAIPDLYHMANDVEVEALTTRINAKIESSLKLMCYFVDDTGHVQKSQIWSPGLMEFDWNPLRIVDAKLNSIHHLDISWRSVSW